MNKAQIAEVKEMIKYGQLWDLEECWKEYKQSDIEYENDSYLFQTFFIHACLYNQLICAQWLYDLYLKFDIMTQSALRQVFNYCCHLSRKNKNGRLMTKWLEGIVAENRKKFGVNK